MSWVPARDGRWLQNWNRDDGDALLERPELARRREAIAALVRQLVRPADSGA